ncbi:MAG: thermonuclease family protein [Beijerinckiaceae bacterium]
MGIKRRLLPMTARRIMRSRFQICLACAFIAFSAAGGAQASNACLPEKPVAAHVSAVTDRGELRLSDGRLARLPGIDLGADTLPAPMWTRHLASLRTEMAGKDIVIDAGQGFEDRWGRITIHGRFVSETESLHHRLVGSGLARVLPTDSNEACQRGLLRLEMTARSEKLGLWREPAMRVLAARETDALKALAGRYALVEGKVVSVNARPQRTYVNYGKYFTRDFSVTISRRQRAVLEKAGISLSALKDKTVRVRGIIAGRLAPQIDVVSAAQIEVDD